MQQEAQASLIRHFQELPKERPRFLEPHPAAGPAAVASAAIRMKHGVHTTEQPPLVWTVGDPAPQQPRHRPARDMGGRK